MKSVQDRLYHAGKTEQALNKEKSIEEVLKESQEFIEENPSNYVLFYSPCVSFLREIWSGIKSLANAVVLCSSPIILVGGLFSWSAYKIVTGTTKNDVYFSQRGDLSCSKDNCYIEIGKLENETFYGKKEDGLIYLLNVFGNPVSEGFKRIVPKGSGFEAYNENKICELDYRGRRIFCNTKHK